MQKNTNNKLLAAVAAAAVLGQAAGALAQGATGSTTTTYAATSDNQSTTRYAEHEGWHFETTIYGWAKSLDGESDGRGVDLNFKDDILDVLTGAFFITFEAERDNLLLFANYEYTKLELDRDLDTTISVPFDPPGFLPPTTIDVDASASTDVSDVQHMFELGAGWRVLNNDGFDVWLHGGVRYFDYTLDIDIDNITVAPPPGLSEPINVPGRSISSGDEWFQPFVGARFSKQFLESWRLRGRVDFGINPFTSDESNQSWTTELLVDWRFSHWGSVMFGYRYEIMDYDNGSSSEPFSWDMDEKGPIIGLSLFF
jgi:hypothetical protein